jgi:hypothetical protein
MIKLPIPFSMGTYGEPDPMTFEYEIDHPILNIGSSYSSLKDEVAEWLDANLGKSWSCEWDNYGAEYRMIFESEEDMTLFLLRWR